MRLRLAIDDARKAIVRAERRLAAIAATSCGVHASVESQEPTPITRCVVQVCGSQATQRVTGRRGGSPRRHYAHVRCVARSTLRMPKFTIVIQWKWSSRFFARAASAREREVLPGERRRLGQRRLDVQPRGAFLVTHRRPRETYSAR